MQGLLAVALVLFASPDSGMRDQINNVLATLKVLEAKAPRSTDLGSVPPWAVLRGQEARSRPPRQTHTQPQRSSLEQILAREKSSEILAYAAIWLATERDPSDIESIERFIDRTDAGVSLPDVIMTQQVQRSYPVSWRRYNLGQAALHALGIIVGQRFADAPAYRKWKKDNPSLKESYSYWTSTLKGASGEELRQLGQKLRSRNNELFWRVILLNGGMHLNEDDLIVALRKDLLPSKLIRLLKEESRWPEMKGGSGFQGLVLWVMQHGDQIFAGEHAELLKKIFDTPSLAAHKYHRDRAAVALSRLDPDNATLYLHDPNLKSCSEIVMRELTLRFLDQDSDRIAQMFERCDDNSARRAVLEALAKNSNGKPFLKRLLSNPKIEFEDPSVVAALIQTSIALGARDEFPLRSELYVRLRKGGSAREETAEREAKAKVASVDCVRRARAWLRIR